MITFLRFVLYSNGACSIRTAIMIKIKLSTGLKGVPLYTHIFTSCVVSERFFVVF